MSVISSAYSLAYQKSPIFLTGGIADEIPGKVLPLIAITQSLNLAQGVLNGNISISLNDFWADFWVLPGAMLHNNQIGNYTFANQRVAANSIIALPLDFSMHMSCPARSAGGMVSKIMTATALKNAIDNHVFRGGTFDVLTPSYFYKGCVLKSMKDVSTGEYKQKQTDWQWDFEQPLTALNDVTQNLEGALFQKLTGGVPTGTSWGN